CHRVGIRRTELAIDQHGGRADGCLPPGQSEDPEIQIAEIRTALIATCSGTRESAQDESSVARPLEAIETVVVGSAERLVPKPVAIGVQTNEPGMATSELRALFIAFRPGE